MTNGIKRLASKIGRKFRDVSQLGVTGVFILSQILIPAFAVQPVRAAAGGASGPSVPVSDGGVTPTLYLAGDNYPGGNVSCSQLGFTSGSTRNDYDNDNNDDFDDAWPVGLTVTTDGTYVDWDSTFAIGAVIVKGGPNANVYEYNPADTSDEGLASPNNAHPSGDTRPFGLSNLTFCYNTESNSETTVQVIKKLQPTDDPGLFDLKIEGQVEADDVGHNGSTDKVVVDDTQDISVGEKAADGTSLDDYTTSIECRNEGGQGSVIDSANPDGSTSRGLVLEHEAVHQGDDIVCVITNSRVPLVNYCDPTQRPDGMSIAEWLSENKIDGSDCFEIDIVKACGYLNVTVTQYPTQDGWAPYEAVYTTDGTVVYPANAFPANFDEDENGGSVDVTWYLVGPESDYLAGFDLPNFWDEIGETLTVDTDCKDPIRIRVDKLIDKDGNLQTDDDQSDAAGWEFDIDGPTDVGLVTTQGNGSTSPETIDPGTYSVTESVAEGYELLHAECVERVSKTPLGNLDFENSAVTDINATDEDVVCTFINAKKKEQPKVVVLKQTDPRKSDEKFKFIVWNNHSFADFFKLDTDWRTDETSNFHITEVEPGSVSVFEFPDRDWMTKFRCKVFGGRDEHHDQLELFSLNGLNQDYERNHHGYEYGNWAKGFELDYGETLFCKFINTQKAEIEVVKYEDKDRDGKFDKYKEPTLPGWKMFLDKRDDCQPRFETVLTFNQTPEPRDERCDEPEQYERTFNYCWSHDYCDITNHEGEADFKHLKPRQTYILSESEKQLKDGWKLSDIDCFVRGHRGGLERIGELRDFNQYALRLKPGAKVKCFVGNHRHVELNIVKSNDAVDALLPGQTANFEIVVSIPEDASPLDEVQVYDLLPEGLTYVAGSAAVAGGPLLNTPDYSTADPAVWELGDLEPGDVRVLTYAAVVDEDTAPGTYTNVAWTDACLAHGRTHGDYPFPNFHSLLIQTEEVEEECDRDVLGNVDRECVVAEEPEYQLFSFGYDYDKEDETEEEPANCDPFVESDVTVAAVLGESETFVLAVTGAPAILMPIAGLGIMAIALGAALPNRRWRRLLDKFGSWGRASVMNLMALVISLSLVANVSAASNVWKLTVADLADQTMASSVNLPFSIAATSSSNGFEVTLDVDGPGANDFSDSANFSGPHTSSFDFPLPVDGSYLVTVSAAADSGSPTGSTVVSQTVVKDTNAPASVVYEGVERNGNTYTLSFDATGADKVLIYASTSQSFATDESNLVGEVDGNATSFEYTAPDSQQRYFALVAQDDAGNRSPVVGDSGTSVTDGTVATDSGVVGTTAATDSNQADDSEGQEQAATDDAIEDPAAENDGNNNVVITVLVLAGLAALLYYYFVRRPNELAN